MSNNLEEMSIEDLRELLQAPRQTLTALVDSLANRPDMQELFAVKCIRTIWLRRSASAVKEPDRIRQVFQAGVAALVNVQSVEAADAEMRWRGLKGN